MYSVSSKTTVCIIYSKKLLICYKINIKTSESDVVFGNYTSSLWHFVLKTSALFLFSH